MYCTGLVGTMNNGNFIDKDLFKSTIHQLCSFETFNFIFYQVGMRDRLKGSKKEVRPLGRDNGGRINELKAKLSSFRCFLTRYTPGGVV